MRRASLPATSISFQHSKSAKLCGNPSANEPSIPLAMSSASVLSNGGPTSPVRYPVGHRRQSTTNSLSSSHRSIVAPEADAVAAAQKQAVDSLTSIDLATQLVALLEEKRRDHGRLEVEVEKSQLSRIRGLADCAWILARRFFADLGFCRHTYASSTLRFEAQRETCTERA